MSQALRKIRKPARRRRPGTVSKLLVLICAAAVPGCASLELNEAHVFDTGFLSGKSSIVRSQSSAATDDSRHEATTTVAADYSPLRTTSGKKNGITIKENAGTGDAPVYTSGHSFVKHRARLGRPIPLPDKEDTPPKIAVADEAADDQSSGLRFENAGWLPIPEQSPPQEPVVNDVSPFGVPADMSGSAATGEPESSTSETHITTNSVEKQIPDSTTDNDVTIPKEPTVLDILRGYIPRREETPTERGRKTTRRWTDPFGLRRDRETETGDIALGATTPLSPQAESETTAAEALVEGSAIQGRADLLEPLITQIERELAEWTKLPGGNPDNEVEWLRRQTDLRMLYLIAGRSAESIRVIESLPEKEQEFWQSMMLAMESYRRYDETTPRSDQLTETLEYIRTASRQLQPLSTMKIRRLNFCNRIDGFGAISVFPISDFNAGQPLLLYAEIENHRSELTEDGRYRSVFAAMIEFYREGNSEPIASRTIRLPEIEDLCAAERTDYFQSYELTVPSLSPGKYTLHLRVRDQLSQQTATTSLPFEIRPLDRGQ